jgi:enoyl-CoA hydratase/carnithine racemase
VSDRVLIDVKAGVADVRLNRPEKLNALDDAMFSGLIEAGEVLASDASLRAVVLSSEGRGFSAGLDFASFQAAAAANSDRGDPESRGARGLLRSSDHSPANRAQRAAWIWQEVPVPVIAAVHGVAFGGGLQIALGADIRFVAPDVRMSILEIKWGLIPDMAGSQLLRRLLPLDVIKELTWTGREVAGEEAVRLGLATYVADDPRAAACELAQTIASKSPDAIRSGKRLLNASALLSLEAGLQLEAKEQAALLGSPNQVEATLANLQQRAAHFQDPE